MMLTLENVWVVDGVILALSIYILVHGYRKGVLAQLIRFISLGVAGFIMVHFWKEILEFLQKSQISLLSKEAMIWIVGIFIFIRLGLYIIFRLFYPKKKKGVVHFIDHLAGLFVGIIEIGLLLFIWIHLCQTPLIDNGKTYLETSVLNPVYGWVERLV